MARPDPNPQDLTAAEAVCAARGGKLTEPRRAVLDLLLASDRPLGAYELIDQMSARRVPTNPPTVYRALEFLEGLGLIHRIDSQKAYVVCQGAAGRHHPVFLVCRICKRATEVALPRTGMMLESLAMSHAFKPEQIVQEVEGQCRACADVDPLRS